MLLSWNKREKNLNERKKESVDWPTFYVSTCQNSEFLWTIRKTLCHSICPFICHSCNNTKKNFFLWKYGTGFSLSLSPSISVLCPGLVSIIRFCWLCDEGNATTIPFSFFCIFFVSFVYNVCIVNARRWGKAKSIGYGYNNGFFIRRPKDDNNNRHEMNAKWGIKIEKKKNNTKTN